MAREAKGLKQEGAAAALVGLKTKSAISDYETGATQVPQHRLRRLAKAYGWALVIFTEPGPTAEEQAQERMAQLARAALRVARQVSEEEEGEGPHGDGGSPGEPPQRQLG